MRDGQVAIAATLLRGPDHRPADLFAGDTAAVLRGLRVHANTISHARLRALEATFPRTRDHLGAAEFNRVSRAFVDVGGAQGRPLALIGATFPGWLADPLAADLARAEWAWLESYHAADAAALTLADLAGLDEAALLGLAVRRHPAVRVVALSRPAAPLLDPGLARDVRALLVARPDAEVRLLAITAADVAALDMASEMSPLGNLIAHLAEMHPEGGAAVAALIAAGAFERV
ncbi:putative DNA-binding domain-containing protein [Sphingopyxis sp. L1A2A]|uniref:HvfC/BufC family peptide modification chaperone n=1 Tax=Sphingopyxis sp. L1A2A TaxID=2502247 RepID=UPI0010F5873B|nr:putative DNA-binding domain-containing protein [Sphingopyxis sp. L1A2A]